MSWNYIVKDKKPEYVRHAVVPLWGGMELIGCERDQPMKKHRTDVMGFKVHLTSLRLRTFYHKGICCAGCGLTASFFAIEHQRRNTMIPHFNMYGVNEAGEEVLFTKDHILAKANGGRDQLDNMQTMCQPCNNRKGKN